MKKRVASPWVMMPETASSAMLRPGTARRTKVESGWTLTAATRISAATGSRTAPSAPASKPEEACCSQTLAAPQVRPVPTAISTPSQKSRGTLPTKGKRGSVAGGMASASLLPPEMGGSGDRRRQSRERSEAAQSGPAALPPSRPYSATR